MLPVKGATWIVFVIARAINVSIHAPSEGSDAFMGDGVDAILVSIHAPSEGSDLTPLNWSGRLQAVSIHAPSEGSDPPEGAALAYQYSFNPRSQ